MAGIGSKPGVRQGGRQKGTPNKISTTVRENVIAVFDKLGGTKGMTMWAKDNQTDFYRLYGRLLPTETTVNVVRDAQELSDADLADIATAGSPGTAKAQAGPENASKLH